MPQATILLQNFTGLAQSLIGILFLLATIVFLWGVIRLIFSAGNPEARKSAQGIVLWGIIGLAVMAAAWGAAQLLVSFFGIPSQPPPFVPPPTP